MIKKKIKAILEKIKTNTSSISPTKKILIVAMVAVLAVAIYRDPMAVVAITLIAGVSALLA